MQVGALSETVSVSADSAVVDLAKTDVGRNLNEREVKNLPLVSRNPYNFALLEPGVTGFENEEFGVPRFAINGQMLRVNFQIDGNTNTQSDRAGLRLMPISETMISEVQIVSAGHAPEFGQTTGMVYNAVTPSGTNTFKGDVGYRFRRKDFSAWPFDATPEERQDPDNKPDNSLDIFTATLGGPIVKNKLFFYGGYEYTKQDLPRFVTIEPEVASEVGLAAQPTTVESYRATPFYIGKLDYQITPLAHDEGPTGLALALRHLPNDGSVLMVTAHPDDENNGLLVKLNRGLGIETSLLTVTRGDGGQNEIGPELFQAIGILRGEELAAVHRYDAADQYHTRAYEFGYSFSDDETFQKWGREQILEDVVRVVRRVRPDVIVTMPRQSGCGGQHHQAAAQLGHEAFHAAADSTRFPDQIKEGLMPWQARKSYESGGRGGRGGAGASGAAAVVAVQTGEYDPLLGMSWSQSRSRTCRFGHQTAGRSRARTALRLAQGRPEQR